MSISAETKQNFERRIAACQDVARAEREKKAGISFNAEFERIVGAIEAATANGTCATVLVPFVGAEEIKELLVEKCAISSFTEEDDGPMMWRITLK